MLTQRLLLHLLLLLLLKQLLLVKLLLPVLRFLCQFLPYPQGSRLL